MSHWFTLRDTAEGELEINFSPGPHRYWPTDVLRDFPLPARKCAARRVVLTGPGAAWMYAHAAAVARHAGASSVVTRSKSAPGKVDHPGTGGAELFTNPQDPQHALLLIDFDSGRHLTEHAQQRILAPVFQQLRDVRPAQLCVSGLATTGIYAQAALQAVDAGVRRLTCLVPHEGLILLFQSEESHPEGPQLGKHLELPAWFERHIARPEQPVILGVAGSPNRGKSVFSNVLNAHRVQQQVYGWRFDCDGQSPTSAWYLSLAHTQREEAEQVRSTHKRPWTDEMEREVAGRLERLRRFFPVTIADLPGGNHKVAPPQPLPPGREHLFNLVDALVLLVEAQGEREEALWREALRGHGLEERVAAVLRSHHRPEGGAELRGVQREGVWRGEVFGLERDRDPRELAESLAAGLGPLWPFLLERARGG